MLIRNYQDADEEGWLRCRVLSFLHTAYFDNVLQKKETYTNPSIELVAVESGQVVGLIDIEYEDVPETVCTLCLGRGGMIWNLAVHPDYQRKGIGALLLAGAERKLKTLGIFEIEAWTRDDQWVNGWYQKNGFTQMESYLHVFITGEKVSNFVQSSISNLEPVVVEAHYSGNEKEKIWKTFDRVHDCNGYYKQLTPALDN
ncbi:MAG: family acetyltransferase [Sporolactobacillus laevolacticus]|jgi:GNAT superfamily N-acetyltransferase|nr:family acetyltransferase [Sporolactobacillus laevolacticus]